MISPFFSRVAAAALGVCLLTSCNDSGSDDGPVAQNPPGPLRIYYDPYAEVDWANDKPLLAQHHDHVGTTASRLLAYDNAGYSAVSLMDYSGVPKLNFALKQRLWPASNFVSANTLSQFHNIKLLLPNAEEVGLPTRHLTSPFLTDFIEYYEGAADTDTAPQYHTEAEAVDLIRSHGGLPLLAHPWYSAADVINGPDVFGMEIYSSYISAKRAEGVPEFVSEDRNSKLLATWDSVLSTGRWWVGIAVNDHYGPYATADVVEPEIRDSGKILVYARDESLESYRDAFQRGAFFAIRDNGVTKGAYPRVRSISVESDSVTIDAPDATDIRWIAGGAVIGNGATLTYASLPSRSVYLRAEIQGQAQVVYTQPFVLRHVNDTTGDGRVDKDDEKICEQLEQGLVASSVELIAACEDQP